MSGDFPCCESGECRPGCSDNTVEPEPMVTAWADADWDTVHTVKAYPFKLLDSLVKLEFTVAEWNDYQQAVEAYQLWQNRLHFRYSAAAGK